MFEPFPENHFFSFISPLPMLDLYNPIPLDIENWVQFLKLESRSSEIGQI